jgi:hypothetical protein
MPADHTIVKKTGGKVADGVLALNNTSCPRRRFEGDIHV